MGIVTARKLWAVAGGSHLDYKAWGVGQEYTDRYSQGKSSFTFGFRFNAECTLHWFIFSVDKVSYIFDSALKMPFYSVFRLPGAIWSTRRDTTLGLLPILSKIEQSLNAISMKWCAFQTSSNRDEGLLLRSTTPT